MVIEGIVTEVLHSSWKHENKPCLHVENKWLGMLLFYDTQQALNKATEEAYNHFGLAT